MRQGMNEHREMDLDEANVHAIPRKERVTGIQI